MSRQKVSRTRSKRDVSAAVPLQGIILADSYATRFHPVTLDSPKALLPVCGIPLIDFSIDLLVNSGVHEIFIIASSFASKVESYIRGTKWTDTFAFPYLRIRVLKYEDCKCIGDALRKIAEEKLIKSNPFVLVKGDLICNMNDLSQLIEEHRRRYIQDYNNILTSVFRRVSSDCRSRSLEEDLCLVTSSQSTTVPICPGDEPLSQLLSDELLLTDLSRTDDKTCLALAQQTDVNDSYPHPSDFAMGYSSGVGGGSSSNDNFYHHSSSSFSGGMDSSLNSSDLFSSLMSGSSSSVSGNGSLVGRMDGFTSSRVSAESMRETYQMLMYEDSLQKSTMDVKVSTIDRGSGVLLWHNLSDAHIDICSPQVLSVFEDNWDFTSLRSTSQSTGGASSTSLLSQLLLSELFDYRIHATILSGNSYAMRIVDWRTYHSVSLDIIQRYTYPLVLDSNSVGATFLCERSSQRRSGMAGRIRKSCDQHKSDDSNKNRRLLMTVPSGFVYRESGVKVGTDDVRLTNGVVLCYNCSIGDGCLMKECVIGNDTMIGNQCVIEKSHVFDHCIIGEDTMIEGSVIGCNVRIGHHCKVSQGCVIGNGVWISDGVVLDPFTKLSLVVPPPLLEAWLESDPVDPSVSGADAGPLRIDTQFASAVSSQNSPMMDWSLTKLSTSKPAVSEGAASSVGGSSVIEVLDSSLSAVDTDSSGFGTRAAKPPYDASVLGRDGKGYVFCDYQMSKPGDFVPSNVNSLLADERDRPLRGKSMADLYKVTEEYEDWEDTPSQTSAAFGGGSASSLTGIGTVGGAGAAAGDGSSGADRSAHSDPSMAGSSGQSGLTDAKMDCDTFNSLSNEISGLLSTIDNWKDAEKTAMVIEESIIPQLRIIKTTANAGFLEFFAAVFYSLFRIIFQSHPSIFKGACSSESSSVLLRELHNKVMKLKSLFFGFFSNTQLEDNSIEHYSLLDAIVYASHRLLSEHSEDSSSSSASSDHGLISSECSPIMTLAKERPLYASLVALTILEFCKPDLEGIVRINSVVNWYDSRMSMACSPLLNEQLQNIVDSLRDDDTEGEESSYETDSEEFETTDDED